MTLSFTNKIVYIVSLAFLVGCSTQSEDEGVRSGKEIFEVKSTEHTNLDFQNNLSENPTPHRTELLYEYFSNGGGVAVGDVNDDGLDDIYFTANMGYNKLYLNTGGLQFREVTNRAGVAGRRNTWKTGTAMADVNGDGLLDIYVCYSGELPLERRVDELYINQGPDSEGVPRFEEQAEAYGLANPHSSNQAYFFDHDLDGDLDLFLQTHNVRSIPRRGGQGAQDLLGQEDPVNGVRFYENKGSRFEDVTRTVGLQSSALTYGLGAGVSDVNNDGWLDIYVGNDYAAPDYLYINNGDGTFTDEIDASMGHISRSSMGVDVADINNDGLSDIVVLDMLAEDNRRQKLLFTPDDRASFDGDVQAGFHYQYTRNTLQLNNGNGTFSEIGQLAGISNTDWSWAPLLADYDNDGRKDLFVTNGILHDITHQDFLTFRSNYLIKRNYDLNPNDIQYLMDRLPSFDVSNYMFRNGGNLQFEDVTSAWGMERPLKSNGAAYADFDNDGDLDLVTNNINESASLFENQSANEFGQNYLKVRLQGEGGNTYGIGTQVTLYAGGAQQYVEQMPMRGYLSSVSPVLHFGLGAKSSVDSLRIVWPGGERRVLRDIAANQMISASQEEATDPAASSASGPSPLFEEVSAPFRFVHQMDADIDDFRRQPLMVNPKSFSGPALAKADVNGDGLDDIFVGGGPGQAGVLYLQQSGGQFQTTSGAAFESDRASDDVDAAFFDANGDGHLDLYVASGGYGRFGPEDAALQDRLYVNDGRGRFTKREGALPPMQTSTGAVAATDIDGDGRVDLFVGGYVVPGRYPESPRSYVLVNDGSGQFEDRTTAIGPELQTLGMVSDAAWHDLDGDNTGELIVVGEWMPIRVFEMDESRLSDATDRFFDRPYRGLWNSLLVDDVNQDGVPDLIAGNLGRNSQLQARPEQPAELYYADLDVDGSIEPILNFYIQGTDYPYVTLDEVRDQLPRVGSQFASYEQFADAQLEDLLSDRALERTQKLEVEFLETSLFVGRADGRFERRELPIEAQFAPVFTITALDYDDDGNRDLLLCGNINEARIRLGKYDANYGMLFKGDGAGQFEYIPQHQSGFRLRGDVREVVTVNGSYLFGVNGADVRAYRLTR